MERKADYELILKFSLMEMKRFMLRVAFDGVRIGNREIHSNRVNPEVL